MNKDTENIILVVGGVIVAALVIYFGIKVIDAITHPRIIWFIIGALSVLVIEGIIYGIVRLRNWWLTKKQSS